MEETKHTSPILGCNNPEESMVGGAAATKTVGQCSVIIVYRAKIGGNPRIVTVMWNKTLISHSLSIVVDRPDCSFEPASTCKIDIKPWPFWIKKGFKSLDVCGHQIEIYWDLRAAKFSTGGRPEPISCYYVALVSGEEVVLLLGDLKKKAYKRTKARPSLDDATMLSKRENLFGKRSFPTRVRFEEGKKEHDIVVENLISTGSGMDAEMWISVDGVVAIHVSNLQWKFRGNKKVMVEGLPVQVFWDVHDWFFKAEGLGQALFIFKPGEEMVVEEEAATEKGKMIGSDGSWSGEEAEKVVAENHERGFRGVGPPEFCFVLYACKVE
ncbi:uncharacterized protein LOC110020442 [Phalaenopsis equestris]|uniref:uncharacterized protein LOC110020442 n=1 Tax=Phalaenopsis equestris TaxID=78828 RepID=UPI0009E4E99F|nr:uncharacterized protein LOC110020442 [Phalaenopsis equestris]XP_020574203.1 uncharacterized protein LOC110020442 [Phalaenopsis equestris]XP_020574204.1 uncharacterized protein LOC110020442 [Phalaenopsis equestris]XP_020574205.1 uncharacterized protein LOC110020442 [Phalaenopsis equestris]